VVCCPDPTDDEVMLGEESVHPNGGNHCGTLAVRTHNNQEVGSHYQSQGEVTLDEMPVYQNRGSLYDIQAYHTRNMFQAH